MTRNPMSLWRLAKGLTTKLPSALPVSTHNQMAGLIAPNYGPSFRNIATTATPAITIAPATAQNTAAGTLPAVKTSTTTNVPIAADLILDNSIPKPARTPIAADSSIKQFEDEIGDPELVKKLISKYGNYALLHYGAQFFKKYKGIDDAVMKHIIDINGIGTLGFKGGHDETTFLNNLFSEGEIVNEKATKNPKIKTYIYSLWKKKSAGMILQPKENKNKSFIKTTIKGLSTEKRKWQKIMNFAMDVAIREKKFPADSDKFEVESNNMKWEVWVRNGNVDSIYPKE